ncbi:cell wall hydrolase [Brevundimonas sp. A19_0]|uniref:cell wall hydrolase n=1 Tax=Brevundimonas sp. A19_0 TaxID=2821087 RepID=UPI001ADB0C61|nr:cell wall hydrolase [Brevundimonas sp. A19_0]MBO9500457.1 cell wall hydrolase [Brevundimonas sp. A19_0]
MKQLATLLAWVKARFPDGRLSGLSLVALMALSGVAMTASSAARPEQDDTGRAVLSASGGDPGPDDLDALAARTTPEQLGLAATPTLVVGETGLEAQRLNAARPVAAGLLRPARPFSLGRIATADRNRALRCLTQAVYYEAALEPRAGQEAVAQVVLNRVRDPNFPNTVCGVVFEGAERVTGCQFSFTCDGALGQAPVGWAWKRAEDVARRALDGHVSERVGTATHYHADYVFPWWAPSLGKIDQIGAHIFYRWKGYPGETAAFSQSYAGREPVIDEARFSQPRVLMADAVAEEDLTAPDGTVVGAPPRTVEINGQTRVVGAASLGGRRQPTPEEIAEINRNLADFEEQDPAPTRVAPTPVPGVVGLEVEEVGRPSRQAAGR